MTQIAPRLTSSLDTLRGHFEGRIPRDMVRSIQREYGRGLVVSARLDAGAHAARTALVNTGLLSQEEAHWLRFAPIGDARYKAIVDAYAIYAASEISRL